MAMLTSAAEAALSIWIFIAALKRCATQKLLTESFVSQIGIAPLHSSWRQASL
jgi:hypothetical protein